MLIAPKNLVTDVLSVIISKLGYCDIYVYTRPPDSRLDSVLAQLRDIIRAAVVVGSIYTVIKVLRYGIDVYTVRLDDDGDVVEIDKVNLIKYETIWAKLNGNI